MHMRTRWLLTLLLSFALVAAACGSDDADEAAPAATTATTAAPAATTAAPAATTAAPAAVEPIIIGHSLARSGWMQAYDEPVNDTARLAVDDINAAGGVLGRPLKIIDFDNKTDTQLSVSGAEQLLADGAHVLFLSGDIDVSGAAVALAEERHVIAFPVEASDYSAGLLGDYTYAMGLASNVQGSSGAEWAYENKGWRNGFVLADLTISITKTAAQFFIERFEDLGGETGVATFMNNDPSFATQITAINNADPAPEFIYMSSFVPGSASALKQIRDAGITIPVLCQISCGEGIGWLEGVPNLGEFYYTNMGYIYSPGDPNPDLNALGERYLDVYGSRMEHSLDMTGYAAVQLLAWAIEKAGSTDSDAIKAALNTANKVPTVLGEISMTPDFHMMYDYPVRMNEIVDGEHVFLQLWEPAVVNLTGEGLPDL